MVFRYLDKFQFIELNGRLMWCDFGANLVQHFMRRYSRYSRYRTKSHDKATISHDITRYSRYQTVLLKLEEIIGFTDSFKIFQKLQLPFLGAVFLRVKSKASHIMKKPLDSQMNPRAAGLFVQIEVSTAPYGSQICTPRESCVVAFNLAHVSWGVHLMNQQSAKKSAHNRGRH